MRKNKLPKCLGHLSITLHTAFIGTDTDDKRRFRYSFYVDGVLMFGGDDFVVPYHQCEMYNKNLLNKKSILSILTFLTLKPGDTDSEYFENYTERQLEWAESDMAEEIRMVLME